MLKGFDFRNMANDKKYCGKRKGDEDCYSRTLLMLMVEEGSEKCV